MAHYQPAEAPNRKRHTLPILAVLLAAHTGSSETPATAPAKVGITVSPETTVLTGPLRADGTVDYIAAVNARDSAGVTPDNNAAALLIRITMKPIFTEDAAYAIKVRKAMGITGNVDETAWIEEPSRDEQELSTQEWRDIQTKPWSAKEHAKTAEWLKANAPALKIVIDASRRERFWLPLLPTDEHPMLLGSMVHRPTVWLKLCGALQCRAMLVLGGGDSTAAWEDLAAAFRLNRLYSMQPDLLSMEFANTRVKSLSDALHSLLENGTFTAEQLQTMAAELEKNRLHPHTEEMFRRIQYEALDAVQDLAATWREKTNGAANAQAIVLLQNNGVPMPDWNQILKLTALAFDDLRLVGDPSLTAAEREAHKKTLDICIANMDRLVTEDDKANAHGPEASLLPRAGETQTAYSDRVGYHVISMLMPSRTGTIRAEVADANNHLDWAGVCVALARYKLDHSTYPDTLDELTKGSYLPRLPPDAEGHKTTYLRRDKGYAITLTGNDGQKSAIEMNH